MSAGTPSGWAERWVSSCTATTVSPCSRFRRAVARSGSSNRWDSFPRLAPYIDAGRVKFFAVGSNSRDSFYNSGAHPFHRSWMQRMFDEYIRWEVLPFIHDNCKGLVHIATMGASFGAFHAANTMLKHPTR